MARPLNPDRDGLEGEDLPHPLHAAPLASTRKGLAAIAWGFVLACVMAAPKGFPASAAETPPSKAARAEKPADGDSSNHSPASHKAFLRAANHARAALVSRDLKRAARQLDVAEHHAQTLEQKESVKRLRALHRQLGRFFEAVRAGLKKIEPTEEFDLGDTMVVVVEVGPDRLSLFMEGSRRDDTLATLPARVALLVAQGGADEHAPQAQVFWGAFHAVDPQGQRDTARRLWEAAARAGQPVEDLLPFLQPSELAVQREPIPEPPGLAAAEATVAARFSSAIEAAKTSQRKSTLAAKLIVAADETESSDEQYALLKQAVEWAASAADSRTALQAIDALDPWFEVDLLSLQSAALSDAVKASTTTKTARQISADALTLADRAERENRPAFTQALADTAYTAARKARDPELLERAIQRRSAFEKPGKKSGKAQAVPARD